MESNDTERGGARDGAVPLQWLERLLSNVENATDESHLRAIARDALDGAHGAPTADEQWNYVLLSVGMIVAHATQANRELVEQLHERMDVAQAFGDALGELDALGEHETVARLREQALGRGHDERR